MFVSFQNSLLGLEPLNVNKMALECFACVMRYMGDMPLLKNQHEVDCVNTIFVYCRQFEPIRDEVYCQIMKQTTNNKSMNPVKNYISYLVFWPVYLFHLPAMAYNIWQNLFYGKIYFKKMNPNLTCSIGLLPTWMAPIFDYLCTIHKL